MAAAAATPAAPQVPQEHATTPSIAANMQEKDAAELWNKILATRGALALPRHVAEQDFFLACTGDRDDRSRCPKNHIALWKALYRNGKAPHTVYVVEKELPLEARIHIGDTIYISRGHELQCMMMHMTKKGWIPIFAPESITKDSTWEDIASLDTAFYKRLQAELVKFTRLIPRSVEVPAENLEDSEKAALQACRDNNDLPGAVNILKGTVTRAMKEEAAIEEGESHDPSVMSFFLKRPKWNPDAPDTYTFVQMRDVTANEATLQERFDEREQLLGKWHCAHGFYKYMENLPGCSHLGDFLKGYEKKIKCYKETKTPRYMRKRDLEQIADKKTRDALEGADKIEAERAAKRARKE